MDYTISVDVLHDSFKIKELNRLTEKEVLLKDCQKG